MNLIFIYVGIFLAILLLAIFIKIVKGTIKIVFFASFLVLMFLLVAGFYVVKDANEFKDRFPNEENTFLLADEEGVLAGFTINGTEQPVFLKKEELSNIATIVNEQEELEGYKVFSVDLDTFNETFEEGVSYEGLAIDEELALEVFNSEDPLTVLAKASDQENWMLVRNNLENELGGPTRAKGALFALLMTKKFASGPTFLISGIKSENIEVYPETPLFTAVKFVPESLFNQITEENAEVNNESEILGEG